MSALLRQLEVCLEAALWIWVRVEKLYVVAPITITQGVVRPLVGFIFQAETAGKATSRGDGESCSTLMLERKRCVRRGGLCP